MIQQTNKRHYLLTLLLLLGLIFYQCGTPKVVSPTAENIEVEPEIIADRTVGASPISNVLVEEIMLTPTALELVSKLANGITLEKDKCLLVQVEGLMERDAKNIGLRMFLNMPEANLETSQTSPNYIDGFDLGESIVGQGKNFVFDLDRTIKALGDEILSDLSTGALSISLVPYHIFPESVADPNDITLMLKAVNLIVRCE